MRIGIDGQRLFRKRKFGMDIALLELIRGLQKIDQANEYVIFVASGENDCLTETANFSICEIKMKPYPVWEQIGLPRAAKAMNIDLLHCTSNTAPLSVSIPYILTLHDTISLEPAPPLVTRSRTWYQKIGNLYRKQIIPRIVVRSTHLITVSNTEKQNIINMLHIDPDKISAIYNGVDSRYKPVTNRAVEQAVREKYQLPEYYIAFIGNTDPRKNVVNVLRAYDAYLKLSDRKMPLVMLHNDRQIFDNQLDSLKLKHLREHIVMLGYIESKDMPAFYSLADLFLYPSMREGFGIPIIESMACGTPVLTSDVSSMPEVGGEAAMYVSPHNYEDIARKILFFDKPSAEIDRMISLGLERCQDFSWEKTAREVLKVYENADIKIKSK